MQDILGLLFYQDLNHSYFNQSTELCYYLQLPLITFVQNLCIVGLLWERN
jgi:hypothetical protein